MLLSSFVYRLFALCSLSIAGETYFPSGGLQSFEAENTFSRHDRGESGSVSDFEKKYFSGFGENERWIKIERTEDQTHSHTIFELHVNGRRVFNQYLKVHYNRKGWLQYASSSVEAPLLQKESAPSNRGRESFLCHEWKELTQRKYPKSQVEAVCEPIFWVDPASHALVPALDIRLTAFSPRGFREFIVREDSGTLLEELKLLRANVDVKNNVYLTSPLTGDPIQQVLRDLEASGSSLRNKCFNVRREQNAATPGTVEVDPRVDFIGENAFSMDPANYDPFCVGPSNGCPNQGFDSINVYFQLHRYRTRIDRYFRALGVEASKIPRLADPIEVIVNAFVSTDFDGNLAYNNAFYTSVPCSASSESPCLIFLPPAIEVTGSCAGIPMFPMGREANIVIHEYQHYFTDKIAHFQRSGYGMSSVADALHEGYSDYFAASQVNGVAEMAGARIGDYAFQYCPHLVRDVSKLRVYRNDLGDADPHRSGLSWASGLWQLRREMGELNADLVALKSLFFMPTNPSFMQAVEALVKADQALNEGKNQSRIRHLFYDEIRFIGGKSAVFREVDRGVVEMGFRSCGAIHSFHSRPWGLIAALFWVTLILGVGRLCRARKN